MSRFERNYCWKPAPNELAFIADSQSLRGLWSKALIVPADVSAFEWQPPGDGARKGRWCSVKAGDLLVLDNFFSRLFHLSTTPRQGVLARRDDVPLRFVGIEVRSSEGLPVDCEVGFLVRWCDEDCSRLFGAFRYVDGAVTAEEIAARIRAQVTDAVSRVVSPRSLRVMPPAQDLTTEVRKAIWSSVSGVLRNFGLCLSGDVRFTFTARHTKRNIFGIAEGTAWIAPAEMQKDPAQHTSVGKLYPTDEDWIVAERRAAAKASPRRRLILRWLLGLALLLATLAALACGLCLACMRASEAERISTPLEAQMRPANAESLALSDAWWVDAKRSALLSWWCPRYCSQMRVWFVAPPCPVAEPPPPESTRITKISSPPPTPVWTPPKEVGDGMGLSLAVISREHQWVCGRDDALQRDDDAEELKLAALQAALGQPAVIERAGRAVAFVVVGAASEEGRRRVQEQLAHDRANRLHSLVANSAIVRSQARARSLAVYRFSVGQSKASRRRKGTPIDCSKSAESSAATAAQRRAVVLMLECMQPSACALPAGAGDLRDLVQSKVRRGLPLLAADFPFAPGEYSRYPSAELTVLN